LRARRFHHCRTCRTETPQTYIGGQNGDRPAVEYWCCTACAETFYALADVGDGDGLVLAVYREFRQTIPIEEREDVIAELRLAIWRAYAAFDGRGTFLGYATFRLRNAVTDWRRRTIGRVDATRNTPKAHAHATSLDAIASSRFTQAIEDDFDPPAHRLDTSLDEGVVDRDESSLADLRREADRRSGELARADISMGVGSDARAAR
jgi:DNA-directed RNA polymerase specialized sigma24 family protein